MSTSLSRLVGNLSEKLHSGKCKDCKSELDYRSVKYNQLILQCLECNSIECKKNCNKDYHIELIYLQTHMNFAMVTLLNLINLFNIINCYWVKVFILMNTCIAGTDEMMPDKKVFNSELNLKEITYKDYMHAQKVFEEFKHKT